MKVFISSLISGFEAYREPVKRAVVALRNEAVVAEDFGAQPNSSQVACMQGVRSADVVVLILRARYGFVPAGLTISATHQEYREARDSRPVLTFVQQGVDPEPDQKTFIDEVQAWEAASSAKASGPRTATGRDYPDALRSHAGECRCPGGAGSARLLSGRNNPARAPQPELGNLSRGRDRAAIPQRSPHRAS